ncbi:hypothetical protein EVAR_97905_1 [Eumeta japonica]|uniref:Uncharacterized protein n=1 Tax=Eumeta variegata TaxID=151549 RepID=A0A4C1WHK2_EUMVA|nr:hypothetical protein EVAR_97905_1 [Eumeta japonica]
MSEGLAAGARPLPTDLSVAGKIDYKSVAWSPLWINASDRLRFQLKSAFIKVTTPFTPCLRRHPTEISRSNNKLHTRRFDWVAPAASMSTRAASPGGDPLDLLRARQLRKIKGNFCS